MSDMDNSDTVQDGYLEGPCGEVADSIRLECPECGQVLGKWDNTRSGYKNADNRGGRHIDELAGTPCHTYRIYAVWDDGSDYRVH